MPDPEPFAGSRAAAWDVRRDAAVALGRRLPDDTAAFERLVELLHDDDTGVGYEAAIALIERGGSAGLGEVVRASTTDDPSVSEWMWAALRNAWVDGEYVLDRPLTDLRDHHPDAQVRATAAEALRDVCGIPGRPT